MYRLTTFLTTTLALFGIITMANAQFPESFENGHVPLIDVASSQRNK